MPTKVNENQNYTRPKEPIKEINKNKALALNDNEFKVLQSQLS